MSIVKKGEMTQEKLDLDDHSVEEQSESLDFVLKIHDGHLHDLEITSVTTLLSALAQIVDVRQATFKTIKEGSTTVAITVPPDYKMMAVMNIQKDTIQKNKQLLRIQKVLSKYGFHKADISYGSFNHNQMYEPKEILLKVPDVVHEEMFVQGEFLDGRLTRLQKGKDRSDHITIILNNGQEVPAECSKNLLKELTPYFDKEQALRFQGQATYISKSNNYELKLRKYTINKFEVIDDVELDDWVDNFRSKGASNWLNYDDPIAEWLKERQG